MPPKRKRGKAENQNSSNTLNDSDSSLRLFNEVNERIDGEVNMFKTLLLEFEDRLEIRYNKHVDECKSLLLDFEERLFHELDKRMCDMQRDINNVRDRVTKVETVTDEILALKNEIKYLKIQSLKNANSMVACDLRLNGIPYKSNENLPAMFEKICLTINISPPPLKTIYRLQNRNNKAKDDDPDAVIIAKLISPYDKNFFLKSLGTYKKKNKTNLALKILDFDSEKPFYIKENLTNSNYKILLEAISLKKRNILQSAYSFRGLVYVKRNNDDNPTCIENMDALNFFRGNYEVHQGNHNTSDITNAV